MALDSGGGVRGGREVSNFGGNVRFRPGRLAVPRSEAEVCRLVLEHRADGVRVAGSRHAWSPLIRTSGLLLDLRHLDAVRL
ncbi:MAG: FAD-dependent oxidoreductase, partial [Planctomyces sp.]